MNRSLTTRSRLHPTTRLYDYLIEMQHICFTVELARTEIPYRTAERGSAGALSMPLRVDNVSLSDLGWEVNCNGRRFAGLGNSAILFRQDVRRAGSHRNGAGMAGGQVSQHHPLSAGTRAQ